MNVCSIHFHNVHSPLLGGHSSLSEPHSCIFLRSFWRLFWPSAQGADTDQAMLFQITAAGTAPPVTYRTEKDTD